MEIQCPGIDQLGFTVYRLQGATTAKRISSSSTGPQEAVK
jgi:hypothetical protein